MKISTSLKYFQDNYHYDIPKLGSNYKNILNFWIFIDTLNINQWNKIEKAFYLIEQGYNLTEIKHFAADLNGYAYEIQLSTWGCPYKKYNLSLRSPIFAAYELIAMDKILDEGKTLQILPLFLDL
jgi:hypothetical protein